MRRELQCHKLVAKTAKDLTFELYEVSMRDNIVRERWKKLHPNLGEAQLARVFVKKFWPKAIPVARSTLALMLNGTLDESLKNTIAEALIADGTFLQSRSLAANAQ